MSNLIIYILFAHIFLGTLGIVFLTGYLLYFFREDNLKSLKQMSFFGFLSFVLSWITGGYYYVTYYGKAVKPIILKGHFAWAHKVLMETKEHIFLLLPFLALALFIATYFGKDIKDDKKLSYAYIGLCFTTVSIALLVTLMGMAVSGAVGK